VILQQWAYVGDILASIAVIASLVYLGVQLRNGNREARARTTQAALDSELSVTTTLANHAGTWQKVLTGQPFDDDAESRQGILLFNLLMTESENRYHQFRSGFLDEGSWEARRKSVARLVNLPIYPNWRPTLGALNHAADFLTLIDELVEDGKPRGSDLV